METEEKKLENGKRTWHTPELRKVAISENTQFGLGTPIDGFDIDRITISD